MRLVRFVPITLLVVLAAAWTGPSAAADFDVAVDPDICYWQGEIKIFGFAEVTGSANPKVLLELKKPVSGEVVTVTVMARSNGEYETVFDETDEFGVWKVKATHQGTGAIVPTSFEVTSAAFFSPLAQEIQRSATAQATAASEFYDQLGPNFPGFSGEGQMRAEAQEIAAKLAELGRSLAQLDAEARQLEQELQNQDADIPAEVKQDLAEAAQLAAEATEETRLTNDEIDRLIDETRQATDWCFMFQSYQLIFERAGKLLGYLDTKLTGIAKNWTKAQLKRGTPSAIKTHLKAMVMLVRSPSILGITKYVGDRFLNLGKEVAQSLLARYCQEFKGTVQGEYYAELLHQEMPFLTMSYVYDAKIRLAFQQRNPNQPVVALKGSIRGKATDIDCEMTMMPFDLADTASPSYCRSPVPLLGSREFFLYLKGQAFDDRLELEMDRAGYDFDLKTKGYYVMLSTHQPVPIPGDLEFPLMNGEWFFTRITHLSNPNMPLISLPIEVTDAGSEATGEYERTMEFPETKDRKGVNIEMTMEIELCSGCP